MAAPWFYAVTFESETQAPETVRGEATGGSLSAAIGRAVRQAKQRKPSKNRYRSVVVVLERGEATDETPDAARAAAHGRA